MRYRSPLTIATRRGGRNQRVENLEEGRRKVKRRRVGSGCRRGALCIALVAFVCLACFAIYATRAIEDPGAFPDAQESLSRLIAVKNGVGPLLSAPGSAWDPAALYSAGLPRYKSVFTRDSIISLMLLGNTTGMREQLLFSARRQGVKRDRATGEEPGKIPHEVPGAQLHGLSTLYSASDTTSLFLIGLGWYLDNAPPGGSDLGTTLFPNALRAIAYIENHLDERGLFEEDPRHAGAERYALDVTYWKDSKLPDGSVPEYPIVYSLAHAQAIFAMRCAARFVKSKEQDLNVAVIPRMVAGLTHLFDRDHMSFAVARTRRGLVSTLASDALHMLRYLEPSDLQPGWADAIEAGSKALETPAGYMTALPTGGTDTYHSGNVWPFEQAEIHAGAAKHKLLRAGGVAERVMKWIKKSRGYPEYLSVTSNSADGSPSAAEKINPGGNELQLWTLASVAYFARAAVSTGQSPGGQNGQVVTQHTPHVKKSMPIAHYRGWLCPDCEPYRSCRSGAVFTCAGEDGTRLELPCDRVNDDYCDCFDGTDEPATDACTESVEDPGFRCADNGQSVFRSRIMDGLRDCEDGSDESPLQPLPRD